MPQYDLAYDLSAFNWRNTTGSDNDYRLVKNGNALFWRRKNALVVGDVVVDSYDTDTSAIFHRTITTGAPTATTQATWNGATAPNGSATAMLAEYVGNGTGLTNNSMCANPTPASGSIPAHTNTSGQQIAGTWRIRFTPTTGTELMTTFNNLYLSFSFTGLVDCFQIGTSSTDHSIMTAAFGTSSITTAGTWTLEKLTPGPINQASWNVGSKDVSGNGEWDDLSTTPLVGSWNSATTGGVTNQSDPGNTNAFLFNFTAGIQLSFFTASHITKTGTTPTTLPAGMHTLRRADNSASITGNLINFNNRGTYSQFTVTSSAAMQTAFGLTTITSGPDWVLERSLPAQNSFCYNGVSSGSIPTDTSGTWELQLLNNSGPMNNNKVSGSLAIDTANNCFLVGTLADNRTAWGSGVDLNTGGGNWILRKLS